MGETASQAGGATPGDTLEASATTTPEDAAAAVTEAEQALEAAKKVQNDVTGTTDTTVPDEASEPTVEQFAESANALRGLGQTEVAGFLDRAAEKVLAEKGKEEPAEEKTDTETPQG